MSQYDVYGVGNALVDMEFRVSEDTLRELGLEKGHMTLTDGDNQQRLQESLAEARVNQASGGSAANTCIAVAGFGGRAFYSCRVAGDATGQYFVNDLNEMGVTSNPHDPNREGASGTCLVMVTDDAERTMSTCLAISETLDGSDLAPDALKDSDLVYLEGYLASSESGSRAACEARELAQSNSRKTAITLSDASMVTFCKDGLVKMLGNGVDMLFCNEEEALLWSGTDRLDIATTELADIARTSVITLSARGCQVNSKSHKAQIVPGYQVSPVDTVGAGDIFAGAFMASLRSDSDQLKAGAFANYCAARLVTRYGARLDAAEYTLVQERFAAGHTQPDAP